MKALCSCGVVGLLQRRGNSSRIQHYVGFKDGKRTYLYHKSVGMEVNGSKTGSKSLEVMDVKKADNSIFNENRSNSPVNNSGDVSLGS